MKKIHKIFKWILIIAIIIAGYFLVSRYLDNGIQKRSGATEAALAEISTYQYTETYSDVANGFSFNYPANFEITQVSNDDGETILVQNLAKKIGAQIIISRFKGDEIDFSANLIRNSVADMKIVSVQELMVDGGNGKAIMFTSDNEAFGGRSREIWFVHGANLYQLSTYAELGDFSEGLFNTWKFI